MDPAQLLRERERRLMAEYGASHPSRAFDAEDLQSEDSAIIEHWVGVYTELVDFVHSIIEPSSFEPPTQASGEPWGRLPGLQLQASILELHLAYWTDRRDRLPKDGGPGKR